MSLHDAVWMLLPVLGGLGLFIFGMSIMTDGLRNAAGSHLRSLLKRSTQGRLVGASLGLVLGSLVQSTATTVMLVGFIHAGLVTLAAAIPPIIGANVGSTVSMQIISFHLGDYWFIPVALGASLYLLWNGGTLAQIGRALIGFGLLFLGLTFMSQAILPHRDAIEPWLVHLNSSTMGGLLGGIVVSCVLTGLIHSSGATIGMCFALIDAGVFTSIQQVFPVVLGAHIGTCVTALIASIGTSTEARRAALAHLAFNITGVFLALIAAPVLLQLVTMSSSDLVRQTANVHTGIMLLGAVVTLPFTGILARAMELVVKSRKPAIEFSHLDKQLLDRPEQAVVASIRELQRVARICSRSFRLNAELMFKMDRRKVAMIRQNEEAIDEIQRALKDYLAAMTRRHLSRRQAILIQHLNSCMTDIERIGDHNENLCELSVSRHHTHSARMTRPSFEMLFALFEAADRVLQLVIQSLNPDHREFQTLARLILQERDAYVEKSLATKSSFTEKVASHEISPIVGIYLSEYVAGFDRIVRHSKMIALAESHPYFWIKREKLTRVASDAPDFPAQPPEDTDDFLHKLQTEGYV